MAASPSSRAVEAAGTRLTVHEWNRDRPGVPILYWHGAVETGLDASALASRLTSSFGLRVLAVDAPGHGDSPPPPREDYRPSGMAEQAAALLSALGIERAAFMGFSWGARIACSFGALYPERTSALVLLEGGYVDFPDLPEFDSDAGIEAWQAAARAEGLERPELAAALTSGAAQEPLVATYEGVRAAALPVLLVTAAAPERLDSLGFDPLARLATAVPQLRVRRVHCNGPELVRDCPAAVAVAAGEWLVTRGYA